MIENGEEVQLKLVLTCAKTNVNQGGDIEIPGENEKNEINFETNKKEEGIQHIEPTQEEKDTVSRLAKMLNL